ncbi:MAG: hypothetical protein LC800_07805 [Acidobacteria bacterium]|nr:hypothetical protein [Acidobacteriota bacterium]
MMNKTFVAAALAAALSGGAPAGVRARQEGQRPARGHGHGTHAEGVNKRGDRVMGFDHRQTTHRFLLHPDGGAIEVAANDRNDKESREQIRKHLGHIARMFARGDFAAPMLIHDQVPPGVAVMERLGSEIEYVYEKTERGARVRVKTVNAEALAAVHEFLRFQIKDHQTGDPTEVKPRG